jgi:hypothetical protein
MGAENAKTAWVGGFAGYLLGFCCYVNLPLLHRLLAGMAKVKVAGKESSVTHVASSRVRMTITTSPANWQGVCRRPVLCAREDLVAPSQNCSLLPD